jgi:hypothetical protein
LLIAAVAELKEERKARLEAENKVKILEPKGQFNAINNKVTNKCTNKLV